MRASEVGLALMRWSFLELSGTHMYYDMLLIGSQGSSSSYLDVTVRFQLTLISVQMFYVHTFGYRAVCKNCNEWH